MVRPGSDLILVKCAWTRTKDVLHDIANNNTGTTLGRIEDATGVSTEFDNLLNTINGSNYSSLETPGSLFPGDASMSTAAGCDSWQPSSEPSTMIYNPVEIRGPCEKPPQLRLLTTSVEQLENPFRDSLENSKAATEPKGQIHASCPSTETPSIIKLPIMSFKNPIPQTLPEIETTDNRVVSKIPDVKNMVLDVHLPFAPKISDFLSFPGNKQQKPVSVKLLFQADDANTSNGFAMLSYLFANKERHHWEPELKLFAVPGDNQIVLDFAIPDADFAGLTLQEVVVDNCCDKRIKTQLSSGDTKLEEEESTSESTKSSSKILVNTMKFKSPSESGNESLDHDKIKDTTISQSGILKLSRSSQSSDDQQQQLNSVESITSRNKSLKRVAFRDRVRFGSLKSNLPINSKKYTNHSLDNEITGDNRWKRTIRPVSELVDHEASRRRSRLMRNYFNGGPFPVDVATSEVTDDGIQMSTSSRNRYLRTSRGFERILKRSRAKTEFNIDCIKKTDSSLQR
ncbi:unnamed protein product [Notodromas monacha]|uniref:Uncharacterized protein n=1 Tax=Notodromas monacha TaxID=399045 RepID=A0A7R9BY42_9CRUS|nr:unnamed protein product [Notodromas monacha]CAG0922961.1 unnamed protein product [Notodromas monacha]